MKEFGNYISRHLLRFIIFMIVLLLANVFFFSLSFHGVVSKDYGKSSPKVMIQKVAAVSTASGTTSEAKALLRNYKIWAMFLNPTGELLWSVDIPDELPSAYTVQDVAAFSKGYLQDYPVFVWGTNEGLLLLGYPKNSYVKYTSNYLSTRTVQQMPVFFISALLINTLLLFAAYLLSRRSILKGIAPIIDSVTSLSEGKAVSLCVRGELSQIAESVNKTARILTRQNDARENLISGVSHDIRTPLSMIMGYSQRIAQDETVSDSVREKAQVIQRQSAKIRELVLDLNLVSKLEYDMQPLHKEPVQLAKLLRSYLADVLNSGIYNNYSLEIFIDEAAERKQLDCDSKLITRAVNNLVQNSIEHNPQGCHVLISLACSKDTITISVKDDGVGLSEDKLKELKETPHYMDSMDNRLDLRHGLGLLLVRRITQAYNGIMTIKGEPNAGCEVILSFHI